MEGFKVITIADLLKNRRPVSGAHSLLSSSSAPPAAPPSGNAKTLDSTSSSSCKVLRSLSEPCLIVGTLNLPNTSPVNSVPPCSPCRRNCFLFSDDSASVCCDVLDFDVRMVGKKFHVVSWNFIPFKTSGGFLEIIKWKYPVDSDSLHDCSSERCSFPLVLDSVKKEIDVLKAHHSVRGLLVSVSPIFVVPCTVGGDQNDSGASVRNPEILRGFIVQILACRCELCCSNDASAISHDFIRSHITHSFSQESFVYFTGSAASWHPAIIKLVGNVVSLSRLKKKLIYMGKGEKEKIFFASDETCLHLPRLHYVGLSLTNCTMLDRSSFGVYTGIVKGIYVQGMVVELDEDVWLLLTDQLLMPSHSIRIGAVITVRNAHLVKPKYPWREVLILGACSKTSISVTSFSPLETGCHQVLQSPSLLGKYIGSLFFPARLWVLLIVQCFRKKFAGYFSEKEILGSNHKEGMAQNYASSILSTSVIRPPHIGVFLEFCKHTSCGCSKELSCPTLNLVVPLIIFVKNCELLWLKSISDLISAREAGYYSRQHESSGPKIRKIFPSEGSGFSLLGNIKISPTTGRLQLIDATCSIDIVVPDLPSSWNVDGIFEIFDYIIVVEGDPGRFRHFQLVVKDAFSCRNIFQFNSSEANKNVDIYVFFLWRNVVCRITPVSSYDSKGDSLISHKAGFFAEAMVLPWDLYLATNEDDTLSTNIPVEKRKRCCLEDGFPNKRSNVDCASSIFQTVRSAANNKYGGFEMRSCNKSHVLLKFQSEVRINQKLTSTTSVEFPCLVTARSVQGQNTLDQGILYSTKASMLDKSRCLTSGRKLLLEFNFDTFLKYKLLKVGSCYVIKHCGKESFCDFKDIKYARKVVVSPDMHFWSLSFSYEDVLNAAPSDSPKNCIQRKIMFHSSTNSCHDSFADVNLRISSEAIHLFDSSIQPIKEYVSKPLLPLNDSINEPYGSRGTTFRLEQHPESLNSGGHLPEGNLVTICGTVVALLCTSKNQCQMGAGAVHQLRSYQEGRQVICLHISTGIDIVKIDGVLCKVDYPIGLGLGSNATFHRLLVVSGKNHLMLTPVSFITVNYVIESKKGPANLLVNSSLAPSSCDSTSHTYLKSICDKFQCSDNTLRRFCCKVVAVHTMILGGSSGLHRVLGEDYSALTNVSIPIAGFILDDGSVTYCCWTYGENATKILRLHEELPFIPQQRSWWLEKDKLSRDTSLCLKKILDRHQTITVKNYGSLFDSLSQDLQLYGASDYNINPSDEELLKLIILNACSGPLWTVTGHVMDSSIVKELEKCLKEDLPMLHSIPNVWVTKVGELCHSLPLPTAQPSPSPPV
ncbi:hypothetical protein V2J09_011743 [Rumex salicifolius]